MTADSDKQGMTITELAQDKTLSHTETRRIRQAQRLTNRLAAGMSEKALNWLENEIDTNGPAAFQAAKLVLEYAMGKPKQSVTVSARVQHTHELHLDALKELTAKQIEQGNMVIDHLPSAKPLETLDNLEQSTKEVVKLTDDSVSADSEK